ncbi:eukaryotic translation initiation factor 2B subunit gamma [Rhodnius prolixus]|uniref:Translation initiation factor eIF2B subunit gamma n=2 Tax=Rhodnius TaxID=13248 RepID=R4G4U7_RHOPR
MGTSSELQAVVMAAGKGSRFTELTARRPKCLLPIGNLPMIFYPLQLLERSGFQDVIIVVLESNKTEILSALDKCSLKIKYDLVGIATGDDWGTADSFRYLEETNRIKTDVLVVSCDLVTDINISPLLELYRKHDATLTAMFVHSGCSQSALPTPGPKSKHKSERDFVGVDPKTSRLVLLASASDYEEELPLKCSLARKYGRICLNSKLLDAHLYIIKRTLCHYLAYNKTLSTLKGEVLPFVVKKHIEKSCKIEPPKVEDKASIVGEDLKTELKHFTQEKELVQKVRNMSAYTDNRFQVCYQRDSLRCYAQIYNKSAYAVRANTLQQYCLANREVVERWNSLINDRELMTVSPLATIKSTQLDSRTCIVAERSQIAERTSVRNSIIGPGVEVNFKTIIKDSVIMFGVKIGQGCNLQNCVVCEESVIEDNCELKDCLVSSHHTVSAGSKRTSEVLTDVDRLMEI